MLISNKKGVAPVKNATPTVSVRNDFRRFMMLNQAVFDDLASGRLHMTNTEMRVWSALIAKADIHNYVKETQKQLSDEYRLDKGDVSRCIKSLIKKAMIVRTRDRGRGPYIMISPFHFWKGNADQHGRGIKIFQHLVKASETC